MYEVEQSEYESNTLRFYGDGGKLFGIIILNFFLTVLTLGIYYPWAKATVRKYLWSEVELNGSRLSFTGTGIEMFRGFVIIYLLIIGMYAAFYFVSHSMAPTFIVFIFYFLFLGILPLAIFGSFRYRVTRTSWRGIHFGFDGRIGDFYKLFMKNLVISMITFGVYFPWMACAIFNYLLKHIRIGDNEFEFRGSGSDLLGEIIMGTILTFFTFYIYLPIYRKNIFNFYINNTFISNKGSSNSARSSLSGSVAWNTIFFNGLLTFITLGIYSPWARVELYRMYMANIVLPETLNLSNIEQTNLPKGNAVGDQLIDALDLDIGF